MTHTPDANGWRPVESAPKDRGRYLFVSQAGIMRVDWYHRDQIGEKRLRWQEKPIDPYTHWQPLPPAPLTGGENG